MKRRLRSFLLLVGLSLGSIPLMGIDSCRIDPPTTDQCGGCGAGQECQLCWGTYQCVAEGTSC